ncbi:MAG TPA: tetratricopeptide repeat protein [Terracidiphilus sp.]|nr:tetratricopeptide repeat protein [Terracidiphilus sp.]
MGARSRPRGEATPGAESGERALASGLTSLAQKAFEAGKLDEAETLCLKALRQSARSADALNLLGRILFATGRVDAATKMYARALACEERNAALHSNLGLALQALGREEEALAEHRRAVELAPELAEAQSNLGALLETRGESVEALERFERAVKLKPEDVHARNNLGVAYMDRGDHGKAIEHLDCALAIDPEFAKARWNRALAHLLEGEYAKGWVDFEARWQRPERPRAFPGPLWRGEPLEGRTILLHAEQGFGDTIQFLRFVPQVTERGGRVLLDLQPALKWLAASVAGVAELTATGEALSSFDVQCPLMSLPLALGVTLDELPNRVPYLAVPAEAQRRVEQLGWSAERARVGLVWSGNPRHQRDRFRSIPLQALESLLELEGARFYSLQVGPGAAQLDEWENSSEKIRDLRMRIASFADTAALLERLDLVVTVDTAVTHLAGALGRPVWVLAAATPDWRWMRKRTDSPWYPTARIFRQARLGDWGPVIMEVREALKAMLERGCAG